MLGGGLAGGSAALRLARAGLPVQLFEREAGPHDKVCGEFLSIEAQADLQAMGVDPTGLGAISIDRVRVIGRGRTVEAPLPFTALGLSRRMLDEALLEAAQRAGAEIHRGVKVTEVRRDAVSTGIGTVRAATILLASGKHDVRGAPRPATHIQDDHAGFKMHWRITARQDAEIGSAVELALFDGGYAGLQRVADRVLNLCVIVRRERLSRGAGPWPDLLSSLMQLDHASRRLTDAEPLFSRPLTIARLPYGYIHSPSPEEAGLFRLGDQAALTAPLTGDGMAIALRSAALAATSVEAGCPAQDYTRRLRSVVSSQVRRAMLLHRAAGVPALTRASLSVLGLCPSLLGRIAAATRLKADSGDRQASEVRRAVPEDSAITPL